MMERRHALSVSVERNLRYSREISFQFLFLKTLFLCNIIKRDFRGIADNSAVSARLRVVTERKSGHEKRMRIADCRLRNNRIRLFVLFTPHSELRTPNYFPINIHFLHRHLVQRERACFVGTDVCYRAEGLYCGQFPYQGMLRDQLLCPPEQGIWL